MAVEDIIVKMRLIQTGFNKGMQQAQRGVNRLGTEMHHLGANVNKSMNKAKQGIDTVGRELTPFDKGMRKSMTDFQMINRVAGMSKTQFEKFSQTLDPSILQRYGVGLREIGVAKKQNNSTSKKSHELQDSYNSLLSPAKKMQQDYTSTMQNASRGIKQSSGFYDTNNKQMVTSTELQKRMTSSIATGGAKAANSLRMFTHGLRGFKMEALGVMFFGMMLAATFRSLLNPALEAYGVMELWKTMLMVVFIPIVDTIFPILLSFMEYFMNLPEPVQKLIGVIVILGYVFGQFLFILGTFTLGIGSLIFFWGLITTVVSSFLIVLLPLWMFFDGLIGVLTSTKGSFERLMGILKILTGVVAIILIIFSGVPTTLVLFVTAVIYFLIGIFSWLWEHLPTIWSNGMEIIKTILRVGWAIIVGVIKFVIGIIIGILKYLWDNVIGKFKIGDKTLKEIVEDIKTKVVEKFNSLKTKVLTKIEELKTGLKTKFEALKTKFSDWGVSIVDGLVSGITKVKDKVVNAILSLFPKWAQDDIKAFGSFVVTQINKVVNSGTRDTSGDVPGDVGYGITSPYSLPEEDDFIWRPGQGAVSVNPNDTLVGYKGTSPFGGGSETNITNNFYGFTKEDLNRELDDRDSKIVNELQRLVKQ